MTRDKLIETMARAMCFSDYGDAEHEGQRMADTPENLPPYIPLATAALTAIEAAGMRVVPVEPSEKMRVAALNVGLPNYDDAPLYAMVWRSMVLAAQEDKQ